MAAVDRSRSSETGAWTAQAERLRALAMEGGRFLPSGRSLAAAFGLLALGAALYVVAWRTPVFAIQRIEIRGAAKSDAAPVRAALRPMLGTSLVGLDSDEVDRRLGHVPTVATATYDREFPHTLSVTVVLERPLAVLRRGADSWLVSARGRVLKQLRRSSLPRLPRIWLSRDADPSVGVVVSGDALRALRAVRPLRRDLLLRRIVAVRGEPGNVAMMLRSGVELRLGTLADLELKLEIARRIAPAVAAGMLPAYLDLTEPGRPVAGPLKSQVEA